MSFTLSKILWILASPANLLLILLGLGLALKASASDALRKTGWFFCLFAFFCFALIAVLPVGQWALTPLENAFAFTPPKRVDGIIVLGGDEQKHISEARKEPVALDSMRRYVKFAELSKRYPKAKIVFSGGSGLLKPNDRILDSDIAKEILTSIGVRTDRMTIEKKSRNTYENAVFTADIVRPKANQTWLLVTSAWHMPRAMATFRQAGWNVHPAPTGFFTTGDYPFFLRFCFEEQMRLLTLAAHEYIGLVAYNLMGRTNALWPR